MTTLDMIKGLVRAAEMLEDRDKAARPQTVALWDDEARNALECARRNGWGKNQVGVLGSIARGLLDEIATLLEVTATDPQSILEAIKQLSAARDKNFNWASDRERERDEAFLEIAALRDERKAASEHRIAQATELATELDAADIDQGSILLAIKKLKAPVAMRLPCERCGELHVDEDLTAKGGRDWTKHPHHTHACQACGLVWRPAREHTVGVGFLPGYKNDPAWSTVDVSNRTREAALDVVNQRMLPPEGYRWEVTLQPVVTQHRAPVGARGARERPAKGQLWRHKMSGFYFDVLDCGAELVVYQRRSGGEILTLALTVWQTNYERA